VAMLYDIDIEITFFPALIDW